MAGYVTLDQIRVALDYFRVNVHPVMASVLAMLKNGATVQPPCNTVTFGNPEETEMMTKFFRPEGAEGTFPYYMPFSARKSAVSMWRDGLYASRSLGRQRNGKPDVFVSPSTGVWGFKDDFESVVKAKPKKTAGTIPLRLDALAAWFYYAKEIGSLEDAVDELVGEFNLEANGLVGWLFDRTVRGDLGSIPLAATPVGRADLLRLLDENSPANGQGGREGDDGPEPADEAEPDDDHGPPPPDSLILITPPEPTGSWTLTATALDELGPLVGLREAALRMCGALSNGMHVILTGPPGTGKTTLARIVCEKAAFEASVSPATDQWTTFDTIGGYFPGVSGPKDTLDFLPGVIVRSIEDRRCLIVDELNRADVDKAFGEMFTLLTGTEVTLPFRRRAEDGSLRQIVLQPDVKKADVSKLDVISVPPWWRIIGVMNDNDKASLKRLSRAFMRRFVFIPVDLPPAAESTKVIRAAVEATRARALGVTSLDRFADSLVTLFTRTDAGFGAIGMPFGLAYPLAMLRQADGEWSVDPSRSYEAVIASAFEGQINPNFQGRREQHPRLLELFESVGGVVTDTFRHHLGTWTGYVGA